MHPELGKHIPEGNESTRRLVLDDLVVKKQLQHEHTTCCTHLQQIWNSQQQSQTIAYKYSSAVHLETSENFTALQKQLRTSSRELFHVLLSKTDVHVQKIR